MEIDKAIKESDDRRLKIKYNNAIYVIRRFLLCTRLKRLPSASMEERIQLFCCIYLGLAGFCIKENRVVLMGVSITFQLGQFILRVLLLSLKLIHLPMIQRKCKRISSP